MIEIKIKKKKTARSYDIKLDMEGDIEELTRDLTELVKTVVGAIYHDILDGEGERTLFMVDLLQSLGGACADALCRPLEGEKSMSILSLIKGDEAND